MLTDADAHPKWTLTAPKQTGIQTVTLTTDGPALNPVPVVVTDLPTTLERESNDDPKDPALQARVEGALEALFRATVELRGTLTGEHGVGIAKQRYMPLEQEPHVMDWQMRLKRLWDPDNLLNPGKIFPV